MSLLSNILRLFSNCLGSSALKNCDDFFFTSIVELSERTITYNKNLAQKGLLLDIVKKLGYIAQLFMSSSIFLQQVTNYNLTNYQ